ncbi:DUF4347 domain-containing protein, partial [Pasteurella atlantica]
MKLVNEDIKNDKGVGLFQRVNEIAFVDKSINDWEKLIRDIPDGVRVVLLQQDKVPALEQISDYLSLHSSDTSKFSAIHLISHGSDGELNLVGQQLNKSNLSIYEKELNIIKESLDDRGDILIYGCDVAKTEEGKEFVQLLSEITDADVVASDDITTAKSSDGDLELEYEVGNVETSIVSLNDLQVSLSSPTTSTKLVGRQDNESLWWNGKGAIHHTFDTFVADIGDFSWRDPSLRVDLPANSYAGLDYDIQLTNLKVGMPITLDASAGDYDLDYPITVDVAMPSSVKAGEEFQIEAGFTMADLPTLNINAPQFDFLVEAGVFGNLNGHLGLEWDVPVAGQGAKALLGKTENNGISYENENQPLDRLNTTLLEISTTKNEITYIDKNLETQTVSMTGSSGKRLIDTSKAEELIDHYNGQLVANDYFSIDTNLDFSKEAFSIATEITPDNSGLYDIETVVSKKDSVISMTADIDDILGGLLQLVPNPATKVLGNVISNLDFQYGKEVDLWLTTVEAELTATLLSIDATIGLKPAIKFNLDAQDVCVYNRDTGDKLGYLQEDGQIFTFDTYSDQSLSEITLDYKLDCEFSTSFGFIADGEFDVKALGLEGKLEDFEIPALFKNGSSHYFYDESFPFELGRYFPEMLTFSKSLRGEDGISLGSTTHRINYGDETTAPIFSQKNQPTRISVAIDSDNEEGANGYTLFNEGNEGEVTTINFVIKRSGNLDKSTVVNYSFALGRLVDADDFVDGIPEDGSVTFNAYEQSKTISIKVKGDNVAEIDESLQMFVSSDAQVLKESVAAIIVSDDGKLVTGEGFIRGSSNDDVIIDSVKDDLISAGAGDDKISLIHGGSNKAYAGTGNDEITVSTLGTVTNTISGGAGIDTLKLDYSKTPEYSNNLGLEHYFYIGSEEK